MGNIKPSNIPNRLRNVSAEHPYVAGHTVYLEAKNFKAVKDLSAADLELYKLIRNNAGTCHRYSIIGIVA